MQIAVIDFPITHHSQFSILFWQLMIERTRLLILPSAEATICMLEVELQGENFKIFPA
jgi:hypothetical protein